VSTGRYALPVLESAPLGLRFFMHRRLQRADLDLDIKIAGADTQLQLRKGFRHEILLCKSIKPGSGVDEAH
jgi:hypothetical protein